MSEEYETTPPLIRLTTHGTHDTYWVARDDVSAVWADRNGVTLLKLKDGSMWSSDAPVDWVAQKVNGSQ